MPFKGTCPMEERIALFKAFDTKAFSVGELCDRYHVSRETFYVWKRRRDSGEARWFDEQSRAPKSSPQATDDAVRTAIVSMRKTFPHFGPKKIAAKLASDQPGTDWPAASTIGDMLKREGLVATRRRVRRPIDRGQIVAGATLPNGEWAMDFKGWFRTRSGDRCDPLTVTDTATRMLLEARHTEMTYAAVRCVLERLFDTCGLPESMRSDNGSPFGSTGPGGLSKLSVWLLKLGIKMCYIPPGSPQDNGRHERMHKTLKAHTSAPPAATIAEQQARFETFRHHYNTERPHAALGQVVPASLWQPSVRRFPAVIAQPWYDADHAVRQVRQQGTIKWLGDEIFIGEALAGEPVGLQPLDQGCQLVRFMTRDLGMIDRTRRFIRFAPPRVRVRVYSRTNATARDSEHGAN
jgi:transposase InsO family protein